MPPSSTDEPAAEVDSSSKWEEQPAVTGRPNDIGPGVYDIHSPRVPTAAEVEHLLRKAMDVVPVERLWVNPDCGLKTRGWPETIEQLKVMMEVTKKLRAELAAK